MPDPARASRRVVVNTTPIIALALIRKLDLLRHLYGEVVIPPAVEREVLTGVPHKSGVAELKSARWFRVIPLQDPRRADLLADLDRGEAEVSALAQELSADLVIIDERLARRHAERIELTLTGTGGVLLRAKERGFVNAIAPLMEDLRRGGIRLSDGLVQEALNLAGE